MERVTKSKAREFDEVRQREIDRVRQRSERETEGSKVGKVFLKKYLRKIKIRNKRRADEDKLTYGNVQLLIYWWTECSEGGVEKVIRQGKGKGDMLANLMGGKEDGKVILPVLFISFLFHFLI